METQKIYLGEGETTEDIEVVRILTDALGHFSTKVWYGEGDYTLNHTELTLGISREYLRAIAKVAFHYFLWVSTTCRGDEREFEEIRRFIRFDAGDWKTFVQPVAQDFVGPLREGQLPKHTTHYLFTEVNILEVITRLQFFVGPDTHPANPPSAVRLGNSPARIDVRWLMAHQIRYYDDKTDGYNAEIEAVDVTPSRIVLPWKR